MKNLIKRLLTYWWNLIPMIMINKVGKNVQIGKGLKVHYGSGIHLGNNVRLGRFCRLSCYPINDKLPDVFIEDECYIGDFFSIIAGSNISIGKETLIASYVAIISENHGMNPEFGAKYGNQQLSGKPVSIGRNCWIGEKVMIMPGVTIGEWVIVGAGSVVTKDIPSYSIVAGNPARIVKSYNFDKHEWTK